jgi:hypothetical protein
MPDTIVHVKASELKGHKFKLRNQIKSTSKLQKFAKRMKGNINDFHNVFNIPE